MRTEFQQQLQTLHVELMKMGGNRYTYSLAGGQADFGGF